MKYDEVSKKVWETRRKKYSTNGFKPEWNRKRDNYGRFL
jgi:hypothetical protein